MLSKEVSNTIFLVYGMSQAGVEPSVSRTTGEYSNNYANILDLLRLQTSDVSWRNYYFYLLILVWFLSCPFEVGPSDPYELILKVL